MSHRAALQGVLNGFLGTYASRYSDYRGYWLFGYLAQAPANLVVNLLEPAPQASNSPKEAARALAITKFHEQLAKAGLTTKLIDKASLEFRWSPGAEALVNGRHIPAHTLDLVASVIADNGRTFTAEQTMQVSPHDPALELKSARAHGA